jgi:predicted GH43/DUF377 family glycosyl hydrolase
MADGAAGGLRDVVFPCGTVLRGDTLYVYYGGADKYVGLATVPLSALLVYLLECPARGGGQR